jgi:23S rRNA-/tRNA-specific pseudouridylate synthase
VQTFDVWKLLRERSALQSDMFMLILMFLYLSANVIRSEALLLTRHLSSRISYDDAVISLGNWARSSALSKSPSSIEKVSNVIDSDASGLRAVDYLVGRWFTTKGTANNACRGGKVCLNGRKIYSSKRLTIGDELEIDFSVDVVPEKSDEEVALADKVASIELHRLVNFTSHILDERRYPPLHILYEDNDLAVVFKPSGIHSLKWLGTMKRKLFALDDILPLILTPPAIVTDTNGSSSDSMKRPIPCHRLDARVSGCLVVAKTLTAQSDLSKQFELRYVEKEYRAILAGNLTEAIKRDSIHSQPSIVEWSASPNSGDLGIQKRGRITDPIDGFDAMTDMEIVEISPCNVYGALTTVTLFPRTGRRHQLRRHCAAMGCPIIGDDLYHDAAMRPPGDRKAAIEALSVGRIKASSAVDDESISSEDSDFESSQSSTDSSTMNSQLDEAGTATSLEAGSSEFSKEGVRKKVGIFLMCTALEFYHPTLTLSGLSATDQMGKAKSSLSPKIQAVNRVETLTELVAEASIDDRVVEPLIDRVKVSVRCEETPRFTRLKEKALKGHLWQLANNVPA